MKPLSALALAALFGMLPGRAAAAPPNIVLILADDLGGTDIGCYGADLVETPNIDRLAAEGVRFTDAYAMSVCSPSRAALLTGKHAARLHITTWSEDAMQGGPKNRRLLDAPSLDHLPHEDKTLADFLHEDGYLTALVGKWHLGDADYYPETHGFDVNIGGTRWGAPETYFWPYKGSGMWGAEYRYIPLPSFGHAGEYLTDRLTDEALRLVDEADGRPFFLYLAHHAPHLPVEAKEEDIRRFQSLLRPGMRHRNPIYAAMIKTLDDNVGRVLEHLEEKGLANNTIVIFASDNGGYIGRSKGQVENATNNAPLRSGKGSLYEGGIRVPLIVRWPGVTPKGAACHEPVIVMDLFYTLRAAGAGRSGAVAPAPGDDGLDLAPLLKDPSAKLARDALYFHFPHYYPTTTPVGAIRAGDWKLLEYFEDNRVELYNLRDDPSEKHNLAGADPAKADELRGRLHAWRQSVGAAMPRPNPNFGAVGQDRESAIWRDFLTVFGD